MTSPDFEKAWASFIMDHPGLLDALYLPTLVHLSLFRNICEHFFTRGEMGVRKEFVTYLQKEEGKR